MKFTVSGEAKVGDRMHKFAKNVDAKDEGDAKEQAYSLFGSEHGTKRRWMTIETVEKTK